MLNLILQQLKYVLLHIKITPIQISGLIGFDLSEENRRSYLMRMCFAPVTSVYVFLVLLILYFNPIKFHYTLTQGLGIDHLLVRILFGENLWTTSLLVVLFFALSIFTHVEVLWISLLGLLQSQGDIHIELSILCLCAVFYGRSIRNFSYINKAEGLTNMTWKFLSGVTFFAHSVSVYIVINLLRYLVQNGYFSATMYVNRFEFFAMVIFIFYFTELVMLSVWGHFFYQKLSQIQNISRYLVRYSCYKFLQKFKLEQSEKMVLLQFIEKKLESKQNWQESDLDLMPKRVIDLHKQEEYYLKQVISALR